MDDGRLLRVSQAEAKVIALWREGVTLTSAAGKPIDGLISDAAAARYALAVEFHDQADRMVGEEHLARSTIGRYYYAMYHALRAATYTAREGDDYQEHAKLHQYLPDDLPDRDKHADTLKNARLRRNEADYDPYPSDALRWQAEARNLQQTSWGILEVVRQYLARKGCRVPCP